MNIWEILKIKPTKDERIITDAYNKAKSSNNTEVEYAYRIALAESAFERKDYEKVIKYYTWLIDNQINCPKMFIKRAEAYYSLNRYNEALMDAKYEEVLNPLNVEAYEMQMKIYNFCNYPRKSMGVYLMATDMQNICSNKLDYLYVESLFLNGNVKLAEEKAKNLENNIQKTEDEAQLFEILSLNYLKLKEIEKAIYYINKALEKEENSQRHYIKGNILSSIGKNAEAIEELKISVDIDKNNIDAYYELGINFLNTNQNEKAFAAFQDLIYYNPENVRALYQLAKLYEDIGKFQEALEFYTKLIDLNTERDFYTERGMLYCKLGNDEAGLKDFQEALNIKTSYANPIGAYLNIGRVYLNRKDFDNADKNFDNALQIINEKEEKGRLLETIGDLNINHGRKSCALNYYKEALKYSSNKKQVKNLKNKINSIK